MTRRPARLLLPYLLLALALAAGQAGAAAGSSLLLERYRQVLALDPDNLPVRYRLGLALLVAGDNEAAVAELRRAYPAFSDNLEMNYNLGLAYLRLADPDSALVYLAEADRLGARGEPEVFPLAGAYYQAALLYYDQGEEAEAVRLLRRVLELEPGRHEIRRFLGELAWQAGRLAEAEAAFSAYLDAYPDEVQVREYLFALHFNRGLAALERNQAAAARQAMQQALTIVPESPFARYYLAYLDYQEGAPARAAPRLAPGFADFPEELRAGARPLLFNCALALRRAGQLEEAAAALAPLTEPGSRELKPLLLAAQVDLERGAFPSARALFERALALAPAQAEAVEGLVAASRGEARLLAGAAREAYRREDWLQARELSRQALALDPAEPVAQAYLKDLEARLAATAEAHFAAAEELDRRGDVAGALTELRAGLALAPASRRGLILAPALQGKAERVGAARLDQARRHLAAGELDAARGAFAEVLDLVPDQTEARAGLVEVELLVRAEGERWFAVGEGALERGQLGEARTAFQQVLRLVPAHPEVPERLERIAALEESLVAEELRWARQAREQGDLEAALGHVERAAAIGPASPPAVAQERAAVVQARRQRSAALTQRAATLAEQQKWNLAATAYRQALVLTPGYEPARSGLERIEQGEGAVRAALLSEARAAFAGNDPERGLSALRRLLELAPDHADALALLAAEQPRLADAAARLLAEGERLRGAGDPAAARALYARVLVLDPGNDAARAAQRQLDRELSGGRAEQAEQLYLEGVALYTRGALEDAARRWQQVLDLVPGHDGAQRNLDKARRKLERLKERQDG